MAVVVVVVIFLSLPLLNRYTNSSFSLAGIIKCVTLTTLYINSMWWPPNLSVGGMIHQTVFLVLSALSAFNYVMGTICGPGFLPLKWEPKVSIRTAATATMPNATSKSNYGRVFRLLSPRLYFKCMKCLSNIWFTIFVCLFIFSLYFCFMCRTYRISEPKNCCNFAVYARDTKHLDHIIAESVNDVLWRWIITVLGSIRLVHILLAHNYIAINIWLL